MNKFKREINNQLKMQMFYMNYGKSTLLIYYLYLYISLPVLILEMVLFVQAISNGFYISYLLLDIMLWIALIAGNRYMYNLMSKNVSFLKIKLQKEIFNMKRLNRKRVQKMLKKERRNKVINDNLDQMIGLGYVCLRGMIVPLILLATVFSLEFVLNNDPNGLNMLIADYVLYCLTNYLSNDFATSLASDNITVPNTQAIEPEYIFGLIKSIKNLFSKDK